MRNWSAIEWTMAAAFAGIVATLAVMIVASYQLQRDHPCIRSHVEHGRLQYIQHIGDGSSGVSIPIYGDETVCDERRP